jgi:hypothetical protein
MGAVEIDECCAIWILIDAVTMGSSAATSLLAQVLHECQSYNDYSQSSATLPIFSLNIRAFFVARCHASAVSLVHLLLHTHTRRRNAGMRVLRRRIAPCFFFGLTRVSARVGKEAKLIWCGVCAQCDCGRGKPTRFLDTRWDSGLMMCT